MLSSSTRLYDLSHGTKLPQPSHEHVCAPGPRTLRFKFLPVLLVSSLMLAGASFARGQTSDDIVAIVNGKPISLRDVDAASTSKIISLQQQIFALRKVALENLITRKVLETEAARRGISVDLLKKSLMEGPVEVAPDKLEELYTENLAAFASMSADEAKEKLRLDLEAQGRLQRY